MKKYALLSVYDKTGIAELARFLVEKGYTILSTGNTFRVLQKEGISAREVSEYTEEAEFLDGRVKTLHPKIHGGLLARRGNKEDISALEARGIEFIDVVAVNLYPFMSKIEENLSEEELMEFIDIGGPTMIRAAAKNHAHVTVMCRPEDYGPVMEEWNKDGSLSANTRRRLASLVFTLTGAYDAAVAASLLPENEIPEWLTFSARKTMELRYGENSHQRAAWYVPVSSRHAGALSDIKQHQGKTLGFNNMRDLDSAWRAVNEFEQTACVGVKHASPCGAACGSTVLEVWEKARDGDALSIFGGIAAFNRPVDEPAARSLSEIFLEVIAAPGYTESALDIFRKKKNLRVLTIPRPPQDRWESFPVDGGICLQEVDREFSDISCWKIPTKVKPSPEQMKDLIFAWKIVKHVKSNGIAVVSGQSTLGIGSGQPNRVGAVKLAVQGKTVSGAVLASDAFFPFDDGVKVAEKAGIRAIIQSGGSVRDEDSICACDEAGIAMILTGRRHFRH